MAMDVRSPLASGLAPRHVQAVAVLDGNPPNGSRWSAIAGGKSMRATRDCILAAGLVFGIGLEAPVALSGVEAPVALSGVEAPVVTAAVTPFVTNAAAQATTTCTTTGALSPIANLGIGDQCTSIDNRTALTTALTNETSESHGEGGRGGNATSTGGNGGDGGLSAVQ